MFTDARSKRVVFVAHCIFNQNAISDGTADFSGTNLQVAKALLEADVGIIQMPCPELLCLGLERGDIHGADRPVTAENTRIRRAMESPCNSAHLSVLAEQVVYQIKQYQENGFEVLGIVGINRSPCCGVDTTSDDDREQSGHGVFIEAIEQGLRKDWAEAGEPPKQEKLSLPVPIIGIKATEENAAEKVINLLSRHKKD